MRWSAWSGAYRATYCGMGPASGANHGGAGTLERSSRPCQAAADQLLSWGLRRYCADCDVPLTLLDHLPSPPPPPPAATRLLWRAVRCGVREADWHWGWCGAYGAGTRLCIKGMGRRRAFAARRQEAGVEACVLRAERAACGGHAEGHGRGRGHRPAVSDGGRGGGLRCGPTVQAVGYPRRGGTDGHEMAVLERWRGYTRHGSSTILR